MQLPRVPATHHSAYGLDIQRCLSPARISVHVDDDRSVAARRTRRAAIGGRSVDGAARADAAARPTARAFHATASAAVATATGDVIVVVRSTPRPIVDQATERLDCLETGVDFEPPEDRCWAGSPLHLPGKKFLILRAGSTGRWSRSKRAIGRIRSEKLGST